MKTSAILPAVLFACAAATVQAQKSPVTTEGVVASKPGHAVAAASAEVKATVVGLDKATRTVTLKGPKGRVVDVVAGEEVRNFDQIKVGDEVVAKYVEAISIELRKVKGKPSAQEAQSGARTEKGERPGVAVGREVHVIADVVDVDPAKKTISVKGPKGNVVDLQVKNQDHFKVVKKGDQVEVTYVEAFALAVRPAEKAGTKK